MSGGAFNYAYREIPDRLDRLVTETIPEILEWMKSHQVNPEAIAVIQIFLGRVVTLADEAARIKDLLHAVEWMASGDSGPDRIDRELGKYKKSLGSKPPLRST